MAAFLIRLKDSILGCEGYKKRRECAEMYLN